MDDDISRGLAVLQPLAETLARWNLEAAEDWLAEHPLPGRLGLSSLTRDNYILDRIYERAERESTPVPIRVQENGRMRLLVVQSDDLDVAVWMKKFDHGTMLTSNYPTLTAVDRQREWHLPGIERKMVLFVCGHSIMEDVAGSDAWIGRVALTQESRDNEGHRSASLCRTLYHWRDGEQPLVIDDPQPNLPIAPAAALPQVRIKAKRQQMPAAGGSTETPKVGIDQARRAELEAARARREADQRGNESQGA